MIKKVLAIGRRFHFARVRELSHQLFPNAHIQVWSDENLGGSQVYWWGERFYKNLKAEQSGNLASFHSFPSDSEIRDIIARCRYLRFVPASTARKLVISAFATWTEILLDFQYDLVISLPIDSFPLDTLERASRVQRIPCLHPIETLIPNRFRFTSRGELLGHNANSQYVAREYEKYKSSLKTSDFRLPLLMGVNTLPTRTIIRRAVVDSWKPTGYALYRLLRDDIYSFSFPPWQIFKHTMIATPTRAIAAIAFEKQADKQLPSDYALIPLQFYPETTSDYYIQETSVCNHHKSTAAIVRCLAKHFPVVIKEHPACIGRRPKEVLEELLKIENVYLAPLFYPIRQLIEQAKIVVGYGSSMIGQSMLLGKPIAFAGSPSYGSAGFPIIKDLDESSIRSAASLALELEQQDTTDAVDKTMLSFFSTTFAGNIMAGYAPLGEKVREQKSLDITDEARQLMYSAIAEIRLRF